MIQSDFEKGIMAIAKSLSKTGSYKSVMRHKNNLLTGKRLPYNIKEAVEWENISDIPKEAWCKGINKWAKDNIILETGGRLFI
jgi:hypothetical protein